METNQNTPKSTSPGEDDGLSLDALLHRTSDPRELVNLLLVDVCSSRRISDEEFVEWTWKVCDMAAAGAHQALAALGVPNPLLADPIPAPVIELIYRCFLIGTLEQLGDALRTHDREEAAQLLLKAAGAQLLADSLSFHGHDVSFDYALVDGELVMRLDGTPE